MIIKGIIYQSYLIILIFKNPIIVRDKKDTIVNFTPYFPICINMAYNLVLASTELCLKK